MAAPEQRLLFQGDEGSRIDPDEDMAFLFSDDIEALRSTLAEVLGINRSATKGCAV